jgi:hypothetical protein
MAKLDDGEECKFLQGIYWLLTMSPQASSEGFSKA